MSKLQAITYKPVAATSTVNSLIGPYLRAETSGYNTGRLNYRTDEEHSDVTIAGAAKGWYPPNYVVRPHPRDLDPTALFYLERDAVEKDRPSSLIGRSSIMAEMYDIAAVSTQFGEWWKQYCTLYGLALGAQKGTDDNSRRLLSESRNVYEGDGYVAAFVMASGSLVGTEYAMTMLDEVRVQTIMEKTLAFLKPHMSALDHLAFARGVLHLENAIGTGTLPHDGSAVTFLGAQVYEELFESPIKRAMGNPHARELLRTVLTSRIPAEVCGLEEDYVIGEGTDIFIIPASIMLANVTPSAVFDAMATLADGMAPLAGSDYTKIAADFTDQFRTTGDLVNALFVDGTVTAQGHSYLNVCISSPVMDTIQGQACINLGMTPWGTGGLGSIDMVLDNRINIISGMTPHYEGYTDAMSTGTAGLSLQCLLPNGLMYMGCPSSVTALDWLKFLRWYDRAHSPEAKAMMDNGTSSRRKKDLKLTVTALKDGASAVADMISNSQRNGVSTKAYASFNLGKYARIGQQGPALIDLSGHVGPAVLSNANEWTRVETTGVLRRIGVDGEVIALPSEGLCSSFVGEPQGNKSPSPLITPKIPTSMQLGNSDTDQHVAMNIMSLPTNLAGTQTLRCTTTTADFFPGRGFIFNNNYNHRFTNAVLLPNLHPTEGFKRGWVGNFGSNSSWSDPGNIASALGPWSRETSGTGYILGVTTVTGIVALTITRPVGATGSDEPEAFVKAANYAVDVPYENAGSDKAMPRVTWYWDPSRTTAVGPTNRQIYGTLYNDVCLSAAQDSFVEVATGAIRTRDLQSLDPSSMMTCGATFLASQGAAAIQKITSIQGLAVQIQEDKAFYDGRIEQEQGCYPAVMPTRGWADRIDVVSESWAEQHQAQFGAANAYNQVYHSNPGAVGSLGSIDDLSIFRKLLSTTNGCTKNPLNRASGYGLQATDKVHKGIVSWPNSGSRDGSMPKYFDGPNIVPTNNDCNVLAVTGSGMCKEGYFAAYPYSVINYLVRTELDAPQNTPPAIYPLAEYSEAMQSIQVNPPLRVYAAARVVPEIPALSNWSVNYSRLGNLPLVTTTSERWFFVNIHGVTGALPPHVSDLRESESFGASNPWKRDGNDGYGYEVTNYDPSAAITFMTQTARDDLIKAGEPQRAGMTNQAWLSIQTQGI